MTLANYERIRPLLRTGDVVIGSGKGLFPAGIRLVTHSKATHVGMVIRRGNLILLWESTTLSLLPDFETGRRQRGVQLVELSQRVATYDGTLWVRRMWPGLSEHQVEIVDAVRHELARLPYERRPLDLYRAARRWFPGGKGEDLSSVFCSEALAHCQKRMSLLPQDRDADTYTPRSYMPGEEIDGLLIGAKLGELELLTLR